jgi:hypothetical protein
VIRLKTPERDLFQTGVQISKGAIPDMLKPPDGYESRDGESRNGCSPYRGLGSRGSNSSTTVSSLRINRPEYGQSRNGCSPCRDFGSRGSNSSTAVTSSRVNRPEYGRSRNGCSPYRDFGSRGSNSPTAVTSLRVKRPEYGALPKWMFPGSGSISERKKFPDDIPPLNGKKVHSTETSRTNLRVPVRRFPKGPFPGSGSISKRKQFPDDIPPLKGK